MISQCAALALETTVPELLTIEPTLHQLDIRGDSTGWFSSGFLITSLHHWGSWFTIFPPWIESGTGDQTKAITLIGRASKNLGGDNWGRRYGTSSFQSSALKSVYSRHSISFRRGKSSYSSWL